MVFYYLDEVIDDITIDLEVLEPETNPYSILLFQPSGTFKAGAKKFGHKVDAKPQFASFIEKAKVENVALAVTPEYSCPVEIIESLLADNSKHPQHRKLWVLGMESITPAELEEFKGKYSNDNTIIYFEENFKQNSGGGLFLDPVCYVFKVEIDGNSKTLFLFQFKTQHMGVWDTSIERDKYIPGTNLYILRNNLESINLFTLICSEAGSFEINEKFQNEVRHRWNNNPYLILNIQMNPKPNHEVFRDFRTRLFAFEKKELISLNWAIKTCLDEANDVWFAGSRSAIVFRTNDINFAQDKPFVDNHSHGLYYVLKKQNTHFFYLHPCQNVLQLRSFKIEAPGPAAYYQKSAPSVMHNYTWDPASLSFVKIATVEDGYYPFLEKYSCQSQVLKSREISCIDKERLYNLLRADIKIEEHSRWYRLDNIKTFILGEAESILRLTYIPDDQNDGLGRESIDYFDEINFKIIKDPKNFPTTLKGLIGNCSEVMFPIKEDGRLDYNFNLVSNDKKIKATVSYIGRNDKTKATKVLRHLQKLFDDFSKKRVVVWYKINSEKYELEYDETESRVTDDPNSNPTSILG